MSKACISRNIDTYTVIGASGQATATAPIVRDQNFPTGDVAVEALHLRWDSAVSGTSTPTKVLDGEKFLLNSITVQTDKHGKIWDAVDGLLAYVHNVFTYGTSPVDNAMSSTPADSDTPGIGYIIPFALFHGMRPYDTHIDMAVSRMKVTTQYGPVTNLWTQSGGTPLIVSLVQSIEAKILPGPLETAPGNSELPVYINTFEQMTVPISATATRYQIALPFGDRIYKRIFITQRNSSTLIPLATVVVGTANVSLYINNIPVVDQRRWKDIQADNKLEYGIETMPTGVAVLDFDSVFTERYNDMLFALTLNSGNMYLYVDVTSVSNGELLIGLDCLKPIPPAALRG